MGQEETVTPGNTPKASTSSAPRTPIPIVKASTSKGWIPKAKTPIVTSKAPVAPLTLEVKAGCSKTMARVTPRTAPHHIRPQRKSVCDVPEGERSRKSSPMPTQPFLDKKETESGSPAPQQTPPPTFEDIQTIIGPSGVWQLKVFLLAAFSGFCTSMHNLVYGFIGVVPDYWCALPEATNYSIDQLRHKLSPGGGSKCTQYAWNLTSDGGLVVDSSTVHKCTQFEFDHSELKSSVPTEWQLVCEDGAWVSSIQVTYMVGLLIGAPIFGAISDRLGRKSAILIATCIFATTGPLIAFSPHFYVFVALRFILAFSLPGVFACSYVLAIEVTSERWRATAGNFFNLPFALGYTVLPLVAYFVRSWKTLQLICSAPSLLLVLTWWLLPESPRWLIRKGRLEEAEVILRRAAKMNGTWETIPSNFSEMIQKIGEQERECVVERGLWGRMLHSMREYLSIVWSPRMRSLFLTLCLCWMTIGMTYYGLAPNSSTLSTDRYTYTFMMGLLEFPGYLMVPYLIKYFGRKLVFVALMWICGMTFVATVPLPNGSTYIIWLNYLGKLAIGANYSLVYLYSSELLPTLVRNYALGVCSMMGRLGSTITPLIVDDIGRGHHVYPALIFGCLTLFAGFLSLILPETQNRRLPETIAEVENRKQDLERGRPRNRANRQAQASTSLPSAENMPVARAE